VKTANAISQRAYINKTDLKSGPWDALGNNSTPNKTINLKLSNPYHQISFKCITSNCRCHKSFYS